MREILFKNLWLSGKFTVNLFSCDAAGYNVLFSLCPTKCLPTEKQLSTFLYVTTRDTQSACLRRDDESKLFTILPLYPEQRVICAEGESWTLSSRIFLTGQPSVSRSWASDPVLDVFLPQAPDLNAQVIIRLLHRVDVKLIIWISCIVAGRHLKHAPAWGPEAKD